MTNIHKLLEAYLKAAEYCVHHRTKSFYQADFDEEVPPWTTDLRPVLTCGPEYSKLVRQKYGFNTL